MQGNVKFKDKDGVYGCYSDAYHKLFERSRWVVIRRLQCKTLSEGDLATVFSQFGEVVDVRCNRSRISGDIAGGVAFVKFQNVESAVLAADNMNSGRGANGKKVFLTAVCEASGVGLEVDRCDDVEVPHLQEGTESYGEWYEREMLT